jgi:predicted alpha/beta hydrolase family esterase
MRETRELLFVQGAGKDVHDEWDDKLVDSLKHELGDEFDIRYPRMPHEGDPSYASWKPTLEEHLGKLRDGAVLVGHSVGATILVRLLAEQAPIPRLSGIFLVAPPFPGEGGWAMNDVQFSSELGRLLPRGVPTHFFHGLEDGIVPPSHVGLYARAVPQAGIHRLPGRDHQLDDDLKEVATAILSSVGRGRA